MAGKKKLSRRKFLVRGGLGTVGVLAVGTYLFRSPIRRGIAGLVNTAETPYQGNTDTPIIWFEITKRNRVVLHSPKVEMGQGTFTSLAQMAADELEVSMEQISVVHADSASGNMDGFATGGSTSVSALWMPLRELAATMREMIKIEAAKKMQLKISDLTIKNGIISSGDKTITYAEVVGDVLEWDIPDTPELKQISDYKFIGKPIARVDLVDKVFGAPIFGMDATMPDMLYGAVVRPSRIGSTYMGADTAKAEGMPGVVKIVKEKDFVGVVANSLIEAENAKAVIDAQWESNETLQTSDIKAMVTVGKGEPFIIQKEGDAKGILEEEENTIVSEYWSPIGAHAQLEPNGAVAFVEADKATIMMSTQVVNITRGEIAERLGFEAEQVNIVPTFLGGGFGRRLHTPNGIQAAVLSKAVGKPVKCFFTRKEEFQNDTFRPPTHHVLKAKLTSNGVIEAIEHNVSSGDVAFGSPMLPGIAEPILGADLGAWRGGMIQYSGIPNYRAISWRVKLPFATSWWRSLGLLANTFAIESFMDELAASKDIDPITMRLEMFGDLAPPGNKVVEKVAQMAAWTGRKHENGGGRGFAYTLSFGAHTAQIIDVSMTDRGIKIDKVYCAIDVGVAIDPRNIEAQIQSAVIYGLTSATSGEITFKDGKVVQSNFHDYPAMRMNEVPEIEVAILENNPKITGVGEPGTPPSIPALANAIFALTGKRIRELPMNKHVDFA